MKLNTTGLNVAGLNSSGASVAIYVAASIEPAAFGAPSGNNVLRCQHVAPSPSTAFGPSVLGRVSITGQSSPPIHSSAFGAPTSTLRLTAAPPSIQPGSQFGVVDAHVSVTGVSVWQVSSAFGVPKTQDVVGIPPPIFSTIFGTPSRPEDISGVAESIHSIVFSEVGTRINRGELVYSIPNTAVFGQPSSEIGKQSCAVAVFEPVVFGQPTVVGGDSMYRPAPFRAATRFGTPITLSQAGVVLPTAITTRFGKPQASLQTVAASLGAVAIFGSPQAKLRTLRCSAVGFGATQFPAPLAVRGEIGVAGSIQPAQFGTPKGAYPRCVSGFSTTRFGTPRRRMPSSATYFVRPAKNTDIFIYD